MSPGYTLKDFLVGHSIRSNTTRVVIPPLDPSTGQRLRPALEIPYPAAYKRVKEYLKSLLQSLIKSALQNPAELPDPLFHQSPADLADGLKHQLDAFWHCEYPFAIPMTDENPLTWWESLQKFPQAQVLAVMLSSFLIVI